MDDNNGTRHSTILSVTSISVLFELALESSISSTFLLILVPTLFGRLLLIYADIIYLVVLFIIPRLSNFFLLLSSFSNQKGNSSESLNIISWMYPTSIIRYSSPRNPNSWYKPTITKYVLRRHNNEHGSVIYPLPPQTNPHYTTNNYGQQVDIRLNTACG